MKAVLITGTSQGLGKAIFSLLSSSDCIIIAISRRFSEEQIKLQVKTPERILLLKDDLANLNPKTLVSLSKYLKGNTFEKIVFINNAGVVNPIGAVGQLNEQEISQSVAVNIAAPILIVNTFLSALSSCESKIHILNISSGAANRPIEGWPLYCTAKAATKMFFDVLKLQFARNPNVFIESVDPGVIDTNMQASIRSSSLEAFPQVKSFIDLKSESKLQTPEEVASRLIKNVFLA